MVSDACRLKELEGENRKLEKLLAETVLDAARQREMLGKNSEARQGCGPKPSMQPNVALILIGGLL